MATFYSIVYANIRPSVDERVSIALLLRNDETVIFKHAPRKVDFLKHVLSAEAFSLLQVFVKSLNQFITIPQEMGKVEAYNLDFNSSSRKSIEKDYVSYLARYSNNLISFSAPKVINIDVNDAVFAKLFAKYVHSDWSERKRQKRNNVIDLVEEELYPRIEDHVNINYVLTTDKLPELPKATKVNFIGQNEKTVVGQIVDFSNKNSSVEAYINRLYGLDRALSAKERYNNKYFIVGQEPSKELRDQHALWEHVSHLPLFEFVPVTEIERIDSYMKQHDVKPFVTEEQEA